MQLTIEQFVFTDVNPTIPGLKLAAKRYSHAGNDSHTPNGDALTIIFMHGNGSHKEHWEPTLEGLFSDHLNVHPPITEAWSFDWPNHGEGAVVNKEILESREPISLQECADAFVSFLKTGALADKKVVAVGHSVGTTILVLAAMAFRSAEYPFDCMILIEPPLLPRKAYPRVLESSAMILRKRAIRKAVLARKDTWTSKEDALKWLKARSPWKVWDERVLEIYVEHGLHVVPSSTEVNATITTLKCSKVQEEAVYREGEPVESTFRVYDALPKITAILPVHVILAGGDDFMPRYTQDLLIRECGMKSVTRIPDVGHLVVHEAPMIVATVISDILRKDPIRVAKL